MPHKRNDLLLADDNPVLVNGLSEILNRGGYTVRTALNGLEALVSLRERVPDVLISDLNMPRMSGFELLSIVRRRFPSVAVIAMSGSYSSSGVPAGIAADAFYAKGCTGIARLFEILCTIQDQVSRPPSHCAEPIWISDVEMNSVGVTTIVIACPECLRTFPHSVRHAQFLDSECCCPHCQYPFQLAIVRAAAGIDQTSLGIATETAQVGACMNRLCSPAIG